MANSSARDATRNPSDSAIPVEHPLAGMLGPEAARLPPALTARVIELISHAQGPEANSEPSFFEALGRQRVSSSSMGGTWEGNSFCNRHGWNLSKVDRALSGIEGLAVVLAASECARVEESGDHHINANLTDKLFNALVELTAHTREALAGVRERMCKEPEVRA